MKSGDPAFVGLLPRSTRAASPCQPDEALLALLDAGPILPADLSFMSHQRRKKALDGIDALIAILDEIDGDTDLEPTFGSLGWGQPHSDECEPDVDDEWSGDEHEPSLGSLGGTVGAQWFDQRLWSASSTSDREEENEHGGDILDEPHDQCPDEPSLGSPEIHHDQRRWGQRGNGSRELDHDEHARLGAIGWEKRQAVERMRRDTREMLRGKGLLNPRGHELTYAGAPATLVRVF